MTADRLKIATVRSEVSPDIRRNGRLIRRLMVRAAEAGARRLITVPQDAADSASCLSLLEG